MYHHSVFGGHLPSELPFPELPTVHPAEPDWILRRAKSPPPPRGAEVVGEDSFNGIGIRLLSDDAGFRLELDDTGTFDVSADGTTIQWYPGPRSPDLVVRADVMSRVLVIALHIRGRLCLHGSAVALKSAAIAFVAPSRHGKSSLAFSMVQAGGRLLTDDVLVVDAENAVATPGVQNVRLWQDAVESLRANEAPGTLSRPGRKDVLSNLPEEMLAGGSAPLRAIYNLRPIRDEPSAAPAARTLLPPRAAALTILRHARLGRLLSGLEAARVLQRATSLARIVPVYDLQVVRNWERLPEAVQLLGEWHGLDPAPLTGAKGTT